MSDNKPTDTNIVDLSQARSMRLLMKNPLPNSVGGGLRTLDDHEMEMIGTLRCKVPRDADTIFCEALVDEIYENIRRGSRLQ